MKLTKNEKVVLNSLIEDGRMSDADIARKLKISLQGVRKIRQKLEQNGVIKSYKASVDYEKIGITTFAIAMLKISPEAWEKFGGRKVNQRLMQTNVIKFYRIPRGEISHILIYGFRNMNELNHFFQVMQEQQSKFIEIVKIYSFSNESFGKKSVDDLIKFVLDDRNNDKLPKPENLENGS